MDAEDIVKKALRLGATDAVVELNRGTTGQVRFTNNRIFLSSHWSVASAELFLAVGKKTITTTVNDLPSADTPARQAASSIGSIESKLARAIKAAKLLKPKEDYFGIAEGPFRYKKIEGLYDKKIESADLAGYAVEAMDSALAHGAKRTAGILYKNSSETTLATSGDVFTKSKGTTLEISVRAFCQPDESGHGVSCATALKQFDAAAAGRTAGKLAKKSCSPRAAPAGKYDVIFTPLSAANLLENLGDQTSAFNVEAGMSPFAGKLGKKVGSEQATLYDDGSLANGFASTPFDCEGVPTRRNVLIDGGVLRTYLHNTSTAKKHGTKTTANAGLVAPHPWNVVFEAGDLKDAELIEEVRRGIVITDLWYTRFQNYRTSDFSTIPRDCMLLIEKGKVVGPVKNLRVSDNLLRMLGNVAGASKKPQWIHWWEVPIPVLTPSILIRNVNITKSAL